MEAFFAMVFVFIGVVAVTLLLFSGWAIITVIRVVGTGINALVSPPRNSVRTAPPPPNRERCGRPRCHADNPAGARFCRRCGLALIGVVPATLPPQRQRLAVGGNGNGNGFGADRWNNGAAPRQRVTL